MNIQDGFILGRLTKPFRYSGEVVLWMDVDDVNPYRGLKLIWLEQGKQLVPYTIAKLKPHKDRFVAKLDGIESEEAARALCSKSVYLPIEELPELQDNKFYFHEIPGWSVKNLADGVELGIAKRVLVHGPYPLLEVDSNGVELLLPLPENFKIEVDRPNKTLKIQIPDGLVEVFTNPGMREDEFDEFGDKF